MEFPASTRLPASVRRICVVGTTGSGKSVLAHELAQRLGIPHIELDALHWESGWKEAPRQATHLRVEILIREPQWIMDGNYGFLRDLIWSRVQAVVWLDYPLPLILWRLLRRTWKRSRSKELLWGTNTERFWFHFFNRDSLFVWAIRTHGRRKKTYSDLLASQKFSHVTLLRFRRAGDARRWLEKQ